MSICLLINIFFFLPVWSRQIQLKSKNGKYVMMDCAQQDQKYVKQNVDILLTLWFFLRCSHQVGSVWVLDPAAHAYLCTCYVWYWCFQCGKEQSIWCDLAHGNWHASWITVGLHYFYLKDTKMSLTWDKTTHHTVSPHHFVVLKLQHKVFS